ncbi:MAG: hypothetical protein IKE94_05440 [Aeriscardovia sp.]|nr:hypothetical protein [Aeriscardovia sp.]
MISRFHLEKLRSLIIKASASLSDTDALEAVELFAVWASDTDYAVGDRVSYEGTLYKCRQSHTSQSIYTPDMIPALWEEVAEPGQGDTPDNPIPYNNNMELFEGKYYSQYDVVYICTRSTGTAVYNDLADLVHIYVEVYG